MLSSDVVYQLAKKLPTHSDLFTQNVNIINMTVASLIVTATTDVPHFFTVGKAVVINNVHTPISIVSFTRSGSLGTIVTATDHDITLNDKPAMRVSGAVETEFNGLFNVSLVPNRRTILVDLGFASGPVSATGTLLLVNGSSVLQQYNGYFQILSTPSANSFTYELPSTVLNLPVFADATARSGVRVAGAADIDRALSSYTKQGIDNLWMFVTLGDVSASKDRAIISDAVSNTQRSQQFRQQIIQSVNIYTVMPSTDEIAGRDARDTAEIVFAAVCKSILFKRFDTNLYVGEYNPLQFVSHGTEQYNAAYYVHRYSFEQVAPLQFEDTVGYDEDVAFRDIHLDMFVSTGSAVLTADINLDQE